MTPDVASQVWRPAIGRVFQESRAQATLEALKSKLALNAQVRRGGAWKTLPVAGLAQGAIIKLSLSGAVGADLRGSRARLCSIS